MQGDDEGLLEGPAWGVKMRANSVIPQVWQKLISRNFTRVELRVPGHNLEIALTLRSKSEWPLSP